MFYKNVKNSKSVHKDTNQFEHCCSAVSTITLKPLKIKEAILDTVHHIVMEINGTCLGFDQTLQLFDKKAFDDLVIALKESWV